MMNEIRIFGSNMVEAHKAGDIHVHRFGHPGGYCAKWGFDELYKIPGFTSSDSSPLMNLVRFLEGIDKEWSGSIVINGLNDELDDDVRDHIDFENQLLNVVKDIQETRLLDAPIYFGLNDFGIDDEPKEEISNTKIFGSTFFKAVSRGWNEKVNLSKIVPIIPLSNRFDWENVDNRVFELAGKYGTPLFLSKGKEDSSFWAGEDNSSSGTIGAVSINLPRLAFSCRDENVFLDGVGKVMEIAKEGLESKRRDLQKRLSGGTMPLTECTRASLIGYEGAIGVTGVHEALVNLLDEGIESKQGKAVAYKIIEYMKDRLREFEDETNNLFCLQATPSDGAGYRLAEIDREKHPEIKASGVETPYYTNSTWLPVEYTDDLWDALEHQKKLQTMYEGWTIFNIRLGKELYDAEGCKLLTRRIVERFSVPCFVFSSALSMCPKHGYVEMGKLECPMCGAVNKILYRFEDRFRISEDWSKGEIEEYKRCKPYAVVSE
jgi:ribonucleoside-triphosphate reductase (formate)